jgi:hypothetical protein
LGIAVVGDLPRPAAENTRPTPGVLWGDIHGMAFNQRPLDDYYRYARDVAHLDFAAAMRFSYNICIDGLWQEFLDAAARWTEPGRFLAIVGVESGTVPDGSHRNAYYLEPDGVPPILCEDRPPAHDPRLIRRYSPNTVYCDSLDAFYETVSHYGGLVTGHFHTQRYGREILGEIWQKQSGCLGEEERIFQLLNDGFRLGIVAGSDTHDSMPGNPEPEPMCPQPAGLMAVLADSVSRDVVREAMAQRRVYGTTGARIVLHFASGGRPMGSVLSADAPRQFDIRAEGSAPLSSVELVRNGHVIRRAEPSGISLRAQFADPDQGPHWYLLKVTQVDGHRAWSSPIWFARSGGQGRDEPE